MIVPDSISADKLKRYDSKKKIPRNLTESLMTALSVALNAYGDRPNSPLGLPLIIDLGRFTPSSPKLTGATVTASRIRTWALIYQMFKDEIRWNQHNGLFYTVHHNPESRPDCTARSCTPGRSGSGRP